MSRLIQKRDCELRKEAEANFDRMKDLFPRSEEYLEKIKLNENDSGNTGLDRMKYLLKKFKKPMPSAVEMPLIEDLDRIMRSIKAEPVHCLNIKYELSNLQSKYDDLKADNLAKFTYLEVLIIEKDDELR